MKSLIFLKILIFPFLSCLTESNIVDEVNKSVERYWNPVCALSLPDPSLIRAQDGCFYLYATEDIANIPIMKSKDLVAWEYIGSVFNKSNRPDFVQNGGLWAPDINYIQGKYILYYSMSVWGGVSTCGIGVAVSNTPYGSFVDNGKLFISSEIDVKNSIDPCFVEDNGKKYLFWGSFYGIYAIELSDDGFSIKQGAQKIKVAGTAFEGTYVYKRNGYYYLFASIGTCCEGVNSTYKLVVTRSENLLSGYKDKTGKSMINNGYSIMIGSNDNFVGNGHCSEIIQDDNGNDWILCHGVDVKYPDKRVLLLNQLKWNNEGWPYIENSSPKLFHESPVFN